MSLWNCNEHGIHGPCEGNLCPTCEKPMTWASVLMPNVTVATGGWSATPSLVIDLRHKAIEALIERWTDPEFWKDEGANMDSIDCAKELRLALAGVEVK